MDEKVFAWKPYCLRLVKLILGLLLFSLGTVCTVQANVGLAPWEALSMGCALATGLSMGTMVILTGVVILGIVLLLRESVGIGTVCNIFLIGAFMDSLQALKLIPLCESYLTGIPLLLAGQVLVCLGSYFYIGSAFGCGPRDSLMVAVGKRLPKVPVGVVRSCIEGAALLIGWLLGAKVGVGTLIAVVGIGFFMQFTFALLHFDVKAVRHENLLDSLRLYQVAIAARKEKRKEN